MAKYGYANWFRAIFFVAVFLTLGWRVGIEIDRHRIPPYIELKLSDLKEEKGANGYVDLEVNILSVRSARLAVYEDVHKDNSIVQKRTAGYSAPERRWRRATPAFTLRVRWRGEYEFDGREIISKAWYPSVIGISNLERGWESSVCLLERGATYRLAAGEVLPIFKFTDYKGRPGYIRMKALHRKDAEQ